MVFTGAMERGKGPDMGATAKALGAKVGKSVSANTGYLVTGKKVGENKINDAKKKGVIQSNSVGKGASKELCKSMGWIYEEDVVELDDETTTDK